MGKTFELIFKKPNHTPEEIKNHLVKFDNTEIKIEQTGKFLGVHFDNKLTFKKHIDTKHAIARTRTIQLRTIASQKYGPSDKTMIRLFKAIVRPILEYGHISLITVNPNDIKKWEIIQTKFIRHTLISPHMLNSNTLKLANLPTIKNRIKHLANKWYKKTIENNKEVKEFIDKNVRKKSKMKTPYSIINKTYIKKMK